MERKSISLIAFILIAGISVRCQPSYDQKLQSLYKDTVPLTETGDVKKKIENGNPIVLLDTRSTEEFEVSHLPGAILVVYDDFTPAMVSRLDKDAEIIVYCSVGYRSERIGEKLLGMGFKNVNNLYGGIFQWANENGILINKKGQPTDSVHTYSKKWSVWLNKGIKVY